MSKSQKILYSVMGAMAILVIILLYGILSSLRGNSNDHSETIKVKDQLISVILEGRAKDSLLIVEKNRSINHLIELDSIRNANYLQSQKVYNKINEKLRSIPAYVDRIGNNDDSLRAAYANFR